MRPPQDTIHLRPRAPRRAPPTSYGGGVYLAVHEAVLVDVAARRLDVLRMEHRTMPLGVPLRRRPAAVTGAVAPRSGVRIGGFGSPPPVARQLAQDAAGRLYELEAARRAIPARYLRGAPFRRSRAEVLRDMRASLGTLPLLQPSPLVRIVVGALRRAKAALLAMVSRRGLLRWRRLLGGKSLDDQLWAVPPPTGFGHLPGVREWVRQTLVRAGYDADPLLVEWEIYWRRRR